VCKYQFGEAGGGLLHGRNHLFSALARKRTQIQRSKASAVTAELCQEETIRWWSGRWKAEPLGRLHGELSPILRGPRRAIV
jgi:hypothetical protein